MVKRMRHFCRLSFCVILSHDKIDNKNNNNSCPWISRNQRNHPHVKSIASRSIMAVLYRNSNQWTVHVWQLNFYLTPSCFQCSWTSILRARTRFVRAVAFNRNVTCSIVLHTKRGVTRSYFIFQCLTVVIWISTS